MNIKLVQRTKEFIENYHHINYCEVIIHPDGTIEEARPSHLESLIRYMNLPREVIYELMPISDSPISWPYGMNISCYRLKKLLKPNNTF